LGKLPQAIPAITATSGTLDLLSAFVFSGIAGRTPMQVLRSVAGGPFPDATHGGAGYAVIGLLVHYAIMSVMVTVYCLAATRITALLRHPVIAGLAYGVLLYLVMYWIVLPWRFPTIFPQLGWWPVGNALFSHCICVGLPMGLLARRFLGPEAR
jgi:hypothetical protein